MANSANIFSTELSDRRRKLGTALFVLGLIISAYVGFVLEPPTVWGLVPIFVYTFLAILGIDIVLATVGALLSAILITNTGPVALGDVLADSLGSFIAVVGLIVILGAGLGEVVKQTGVAEYLVRSVVYRIGVNTRPRVQLGIMLTSALLVGCLGTINGTNAVLAPIFIPIVAAVRFTPPALALMLLAGGSVGFFVSPFAPSIIAIRSAAEISYPSYLLTAGLPMSVVTGVVGFLMVRWVQRRTEGTHSYGEADVPTEEERELDPNARRATLVFLLTLAALVVYSITTQAEVNFAVVAMIVLAAATGLAARFGIGQTLQAIYTGASRLIGIFILFWLLGTLFILVEQTEAYDALLDIGGPFLEAIGRYGFVLAAAVIGWIGVAGVAAGQVVLMDEVFGPTAEALGVSPLAWGVVLLCSSQADDFGPFPNPDMMAQMGLARSTSLQMQLYGGWAILTANTVLFAILLWILT